MGLQFGWRNWNRTAKSDVVRGVARSKGFGIQFAACAVDSIRKDVGMTPCNEVPLAIRYLKHCAHSPWRHVCLGRSRALS